MFRPDTVVDSRIAGGLLLPPPPPLTAPDPPPEPPPEPPPPLLIVVVVEGGLYDINAMMGSTGKTTEMVHADSLTVKFVIGSQLPLDIMKGLILEMFVPPE